MPTKKGSKAAPKPAEQPVKKKRGRPRKDAKVMDRIAVEDMQEVLAHHKAAAPRDTERTCEREIDGGAVFQAPTRILARITENRFKGSKEPFAAQGINSELTHKDRVKLTDGDLHHPMKRTTERTRRNGKSGRKQGDY
jgi:hypothetical protein